MQRLPYKYYVLCILTLIFAFQVSETSILGLLQQDIKLDLALTDVQLGLLTGTVAALVYSIMVVPIARWADRGDRVLVISSAGLVLGVAAASCGFAATFVQLLLMRVFVGVGAAGTCPPAYSLIADYFDSKERPRAVAIYTAGAALASTAYFAAGWLNDLYGWRATFALMNIPGVIFALIAWLTVREPRRGRVAQPHSVAHPTLKHVCVVLLVNRTSRHLLTCLSILGFVYASLLQWQAAFFIRSFGLKIDQIGMWLAMVHGVGCLVGLLFAGEWAVRFAPGNSALQMRFVSIAIVGSSVTAALVCLSPNAYGSLGLVGVTVLGVTAATCPMLATIQTLVADDMRAVAIALVFLVSSLIGLGLGPLATGMLSDAFRPWAGDESLRYALLIIAPGYLWSAWHAWRASQTMAMDFPACAGSQSSSQTLRLTGSESCAHGAVPPSVHMPDGSR